MLEGSEGKLVKTNKQTNKQARTDKEESVLEQEKRKRLAKGDKAFSFETVNFFSVTVNKKVKN